MIYGNTIGGFGGNSGGGSSIDSTFIIEDSEGNELVGIVVNEEVIFTADANDIRKGTVAATQTGVTEGTKEIPAYHTSFGYKAVPSGAKFVLGMQDYEYTKLQVIFFPYNTSLEDSVSAEKVVINDKVYPVNSTVAESNVTIDMANARIDFGLTNESGKPYILRYSSYKEIY